MGILRTVIVLSGLAAFVPAPPEDVDKSVMAAVVTETGASYIQVATGTFSDLAAFCDRQPGVCKTAGYMAYKLERKAKYGVKLIYEWANETTPTHSTIAATDPITTGSTKPSVSKKQKIASQSTLEIEDLIPAWLGPKTTRSG